MAKLETLALENGQKLGNIVPVSFESNKVAIGKSYNDLCENVFVKPIIVSGTLTTTYEQTSQKSIVFPSEETSSGRYEVEGYFLLESNGVCREPNVVVVSGTNFATDYIFISGNYCFYKFYVSTASATSTYRIQYYKDSYTSETTYDQMALSELLGLSTNLGYTPYLYKSTAPYQKSLNAIYENLGATRDKLAIPYLSGTTAQTFQWFESNILVELPNAKEIANIKFVNTPTLSLIPSSTIDYSLWTLINNDAEIEYIDGTKEIVNFGDFRTYLTSSQTLTRGITFRDLVDYTIDENIEFDNYNNVYFSTIRTSVVGNENQITFSFKYLTSDGEKSFSFTSNFIVNGIYNAIFSPKQSYIPNETILTTNLFDIKLIDGFNEEHNFENENYELYGTLGQTIYNENDELDGGKYTITFKFKNEQSLVYTVIKTAYLYVYDTSTKNVEITMLKQTFYINDRLNKEDMEVVVEYEIPNEQDTYSYRVYDFTYSPTILSVSGTQTITINYDGQNYTKNVSVIPLSDEHDYIYLFNKTKTTIGQNKYFVRQRYGEIQTTFNMSFTCDGTKDSSQVMLYNYNELPIEPNTIVYLESTNTYWIVKSDKVRMYPNEFGGLYQHTISLYGLYELLNSRDLTDCGFNKKRYTISSFLNRLVKLSDIEFNCEFSMYPYADGNEIITYLKTFQNYTLGTAIKEMFEGMNLVPKMRLETETIGTNVVIKKAIIYPVSKSGNSGQAIPISTFDGQESQTTFELENFGTRVVSNVQNCVSTQTYRYPSVGGIRATSDENLIEYENAYIRLPSNVYNVEKIVIYSPFYIRDKILGSRVYYDASIGIDNTIAKIITDFPELGNLSPQEQAKLRELVASTIVELPNGGRYNAIDESFSGERLSIYSMTKPTLRNVNIMLNSKQYANTSKYSWDTYTWEQGSNKITNLGVSYGEKNLKSFNYEFSGTQKVFVYSEMTVKRTKYAVYFTPMNDLKVKVDNHKESNDDNLYNQNGKLIDSVAISKLINAHANEISSSEITRSKRYYEFSNIPQIGQKVSYNNDIYIINNISVDFNENDDNNYFLDCEFTMTKQTACKSIMISANTNIRDYDCPQQNNVKRIELFRDYIELGYSKDGENDTFLPLDKLFSNVRPNHTAIIYTQDSEQNSYTYQLNTTKYFLNKQFIEVLDFNDNNIIGYEANKSYNIIQVSTMFQNYKKAVNTPIQYTDGNGELNRIGFCLINENQLTNLYNNFNCLEMLGAFVSVPQTFWTWLNLDNSRYEIRYYDSFYDKDGLEVPMFEYVAQVGDANDIVFGANFFEIFNTTMKYELCNDYVSQENYKLFSNSNKQVSISLDTANEKLVLTFADSTEIYGKTIVIYNDNKELLFAVNNCKSHISNDNKLELYINHWQLQ